MINVAKELEHLTPQGWLVGTPDARKRACPVWGALDGNLLSEGSKALSFDPGTVRCPHCDSEQIVKRDKTRRGTQRGRVEHRRAQP